METPSTQEPGELCLALNLSEADRPYDLTMMTRANKQVLDLATGQFGMIPW